MFAHIRLIFTYVTTQHGSAMNLEVFAEDVSVIRHSGNVYVVTIRSNILNVAVVKQNIDKTLPLKLMQDKDTGTWMIVLLLPKLKKVPFADVVVDVQMQGRHLTVEKTRQ